MSFSTKIILIFSIYSFIACAGSVDNSKKLDFTAAGDLYISNNPCAQDPTYSQLISFLQNDTTDQIPYTPNEFVCGEYAVLIHDNAESQGIRAGVVNIRFQNETVGHAINVFNTTDNGTIYIDCTNAGHLNDDKIVTLSIGNLYETESIFNKRTTTIEYKNVTFIDGTTYTLPIITNSGYSYNYNYTVSMYTETW
jgi:hypothetical protein